MQNLFAGPEDRRGISAAADIQLCVQLVPASRKKQKTERMERNWSLAACAGYFLKM
jgi:hypothetical protein